jgi:tetratricopeptide (TPR) repeat protein
MNVRPKTVRRLSILAAVVVLIAGALATVWAIHQHNKEARLRADRDIGLAALHAGDWPLAMERLRVYKDVHPEDYDALYAFAVARSRVPTSDGRHLRQAKQLFEQLNHARPDDVRAARALLELYLQFGYARETTDLADSILSKHPSDVEALRAKSAALWQDSKLTEALAVSEQLNKAVPLDVAGQVQTYELLRRLGHPPQELTKRYDALRKEHPDDPRFEMLSALAAFYANDHAGTLNWLRAAAARPAPDAAFVERLARMFDDLKLFDESQALLERAAADGKNPGVLAVLVERLWQNGRFADVVNRLSKLEPATASADLLALKAMSLQQLHNTTEADAIVKALAARQTDAPSQAWAMALQTRFATSMQPRAAINNYETALARDRDNAIVRSWIADAFVRLGETELAIMQWRAAASLLPSWSEPYEMIARAQLAQGREQPALEAARAANRRAPARPSAAIALALAWDAYLQSNPIAEETPRLLQLVTRIQERIPAEPQTLAIYVSLLARSGKTDEAIAVVRRALKDPVSADTLVKLLAASRNCNLGLETELEQKLGSEELNSPSLAYAHAADLARVGKKQEGLDVLTAAEKAAKSQPEYWKLAIAKYQDLIGSADAKEAWIALGDANPNDLTIQSAILNGARAAKTDREFIARTIERTRALTGDEGQTWRVAKARWLLGGNNKAKDSAKAVEILSDLVRGSPDVPQYRELLAEGLLNLGNTKDAADHLKAAVALEPADLRAAVELARLLQNQGKYDQALACLVRASKNEDLTPQNRAALARMMVQQGATQQAYDLLKPAASQLDAGGLLFWAELSRARGSNDEAESAFTEALARPDVSADAISSAADFFASRGKLQQADAALARLVEPHIAPWQRAIVEARFAESHRGGPEVARPKYISATELAPSEAQSWRALVEFELRHSKWDSAIDAASRGLNQLKNDSELESLKTRAIVLKAGADESTDLAPLITALEKNPANVAQADLLRAVRITRDNKGHADVILAQIKPLAEKHADYFPLQSLLVRQYAAAHRFDDAAKLAEHLLQSRPGEPGAAELATGVYQAAARWRDMKHAADLWRERSLTSPEPADLAAAEALLNLHDPSGALDRLIGYLPQVRADPAANPPLIAMLLKSMVAAGKVPDAKALLQPLLTQAPAWRELWLSLASQMNDPAAAGEWIRLVTPLLPKDSPAEQFALARAWQLVFARTGDAASAEEARRVLQPLTERPNPEPAALVLLGSLRADQAPSEAEKLYRRALEIRPDIPEAQNNLAYLILQRSHPSDADLKEARELAMKAATRSPEIAEFQDTLARVNLKLGQTADAVHHFEAALAIDPKNLQSMIGLAGALRADGHRDKAAELLHRIDAILHGGAPSTDSLKSELKSLREQLSQTSP